MISAGGGLIPTFGAVDISHFRLISANTKRLFRSDQSTSNLIKKFDPLVIVEFLPKWEYSGLRGVEVLELYRHMGFSIRHPQFWDVELTNEQIMDYFNDTAFAFTHDIILQKT